MTVRGGSAVHPVYDIGKILTEPRFIGTTIQFPENPAPVPAEDFFLDGGVINLVRERRANTGQGDKLSRVGKEAGSKDFFFGKKLGSFFKAILHSLIRPYTPQSVTPLADLSEVAC